MASANTIKKEIVNAIGQDIRECVDLLAYVEVLTNSTGIDTAQVFGSMIYKDIEIISIGDEKFAFLNKYKDLHKGNISHLMNNKITRNKDNKD